MEIILFTIYYMLSLFIIWSGYKAFIYGIQCPMRLDGIGKLMHAFTGICLSLSVVFVIEHGIRVLGHIDISNLPIPEDIQTFISFAPLVLWISAASITSHWKHEIPPDMGSEIEEFLKELTTMADPRTKQGKLLNTKRRQVITEILTKPTDKEFILNRKIWYERSK